MLIISRPVATANFSILFFFFVKYLQIHLIIVVNYSCKVGLCTEPSKITNACSILRLIIAPMLRATHCRFCLCVKIEQLKALGHLDWLVW